MFNYVRILEHLHLHKHTSDEPSSESVVPLSASCSAANLLFFSSNAGDWGTVTGTARFSGSPCGRWGRWGGAGEGGAGGVRQVSVGQVR